MSVVDALGRLLARAQPDSPVDAGLAEAGLVVADPLEALVLRALALMSPQSATDVAAFVAASPRPDSVHSGLSAVRRVLKRLIARGLVDTRGAQGSYRLAPSVAGRFGAFPRLAASEADRAPVVELDAMIAALEQVAPAEPPPITDWMSALGTIGVSAGPARSTRFTAARAELTESGRTLLDGLGLLPFTPAWRPSLEWTLDSLAAHTDAALGVTADRLQCFVAAWLAFVDRTGVVLQPRLIADQVERRRELARRWAWFAGCAIRREGVLEVPLISAANLARLDWRRVQADERALETLVEAEQAAAALIDQEKARRAEAARAYASGRRE